MGERREHGLGRRVHRAARAVVAAPRRPRGVERLGRARPLQHVRHLADLLGVHPAHDVGHAAPVQRGGVEERGEQLGRGGVPELPVRGRPVRPGRLAQVGRRRAGPPPVGAVAERRPLVAGGTPVQPVGSMRQTRPRRARTAWVSRSRSVFTLAARTGPGQLRMAGTASDVVLPLWVGPTTTSD